MKESMGLIGVEASALEVAHDLGDEFINELNLVYKVDLTSWLKLDPSRSNQDELDDPVDENSDDDEDESNFFDTYEDTESLKREEAKLKEMQMKELNAVRKKILDIGSKKSALRLSLVSWGF